MKLVSKLREAHSRADFHAKTVIRLTTSSCSYWVHWRLELQKHKEALSTKPTAKITKLTNIHEIDEALLSDLCDGIWTVAALGL